MNFLNGLGAGVSGLISGYESARKANNDAAHEEQLRAWQQQQIAQSQAQEARLIQEEARKRAEYDRQQEGLGKIAALYAPSDVPRTLPSGLMYPIFDEAQTPQPTARVLAQTMAPYMPEKALTVLAESEKDKPMNPIISKLIEAAQNGSINAQGKALLKQAGYDMFDQKPDKANDKETWGEPYQMSVGGKTGMVQKSSYGQIRPVLQDTTTKISMNTGDRADLYEKKAAFGELPKLRQDAEAAKQVIPKLTRMGQILESGNAGDTAAYMRNVLAPYAPESKSANEAQLFQIYARTISGPQRVNIIGSGPQTEKEGELLFKVGGGGNQGRAALRELLQMHSAANQAKIQEYNGMIEAAGTKIYKPIVLGSNPKPDSSGKRKPLSAY